ncbi:MAG: cysteine synthase family protein [Thermodesulfobacteriota bacterium]
MELPLIKQAKTHQRKKTVRSIIDLIGNTPLIRLKKISEPYNPKVEIFAKAEWFNPGGSVKDRPALNMIMDGINTGNLTKEKIIMDSSSGNTAIAYAMIGAALGYKVELVTPLNINIERKKTLEAYGAKIIFSDPLEGSDGAILFAKKLYEENTDKYFMPDQYNNPANPESHYKFTANEIWEQTNGSITHFIAALGTSGTLMGAGKRLKELNPDIRIIAIQPAESLHGLEGMKHMYTSLVPGIYDSTFPDEIIDVSTEDAYNMMQDILLKEGIFLGHSGGAVAYATLNYSKKIDEGVLVTIFPDSGYRYLSEGIWW